MVLSFLIIIAIFNVCLNIFYQTQIATKFGEIEFKDILEKLECLGKEPLTWSNDCKPSLYVTFQSVIWGIVGTTITAHELEFSVLKHFANNPF